MSKLPTRLLYFIGTLIVLSLFCCELASAQASAAATPARASSGKPSTIQIRQNILSQQIALVQRQIIEVRRCIYTARLPQVLRDPSGFVNKVPEVDLVNCSRQLQQLTRRLVGLSRESSQLVQDAQMQAISIQRLLDERRRRARVSGESDQ